MVVRVRHLWNKITCKVQLYLTSLDCDARKLGQAIRLHWGIENGLHWTLDKILRTTSGYVMTSCSRMASINSEPQASF